SQSLSSHPMEASISSATDAETLPWKEPTWNVVSEEERAWIEHVKSLSEEEFVKLVDSIASWLDEVPNDPQCKADLYDLARRDHLPLLKREDEFCPLIFGTVCELEDLIYDVWLDRKSTRLNSSHV